MSSSKAAEFDAFVGLFPTLRDFVVKDLENFETPDEAKAYMAKMMDYTVPGGKMNRGLTVLAALRSLISDRSLTEDEIFKARILGWCVEWLQAFFLVADDLMDASITRRGQPCWYRLPSVGLIAANDSLLLEGAMYRIITNYFRSEPYFGEVMALFLEITYCTEIGQLLDLTSQPKDAPLDYNRFTLDLYKKIVKYKTAFYSFYLPIALAMQMAGIKDQKLYAIAKSICCEMGEYFQIQDDYLDCYADPEVLGKIGTDIEDTKCSWLVVQALQRCTPEQRATLEANYGQHDAAKVAVIKQLYRDLDLEKVFQDYEAESYASINSLIEKVEGMPRTIFTELLGKIYKRQK